MMEHIPQADLQQYADGTLNASEALSIGIHLRACNECARRLELFQSVETGLRRIPLETASGKFTDRVMHAVGLKGAQGFLRLLFVNFLPLAAAFLALLVLLGLFGEGSSEQDVVTRETATYTQSLYQTFGSAAAAGAGRLLSWIQEGTGLFLTIPSVKFIVLLALAFGVVALFDEFIFVPLMKKRG